MSEQEPVQNTSPQQPVDLRELREQRKAAQAEAQKKEIVAEDDADTQSPSSDAAAATPAFFISTRAAVAGDDDGGAGEAPAFMGLYTVLMLLLLAFFIVLVSMSTTKQSEEKFQKGMSSVKRSFALMGLQDSKHALFFMHSVLRMKNEFLTTAMNDLGVTEEEKDDDAASTSASSGTGKGFWADGLSKTEAGQLDAFVRMGFNIMPYDKDKKFLKVQFPDYGIFDSGSDQLSAVFEESLRDMLDVLRGAYSRVIIEVFTNEDPVAVPGMMTSLELSTVRAHRIADYLRKSSVAADEIIAVGHGDWHEAVRAAEGHNKNIIIMKIFDLWEPVA